jgi:hypothetical protein
VHKDLVDILATDLEVTALAERRPVESSDPALRALGAWTEDIDAHPVVAAVETPLPASTRRRPRGALRSIAAMTLALTVSSTGIATAVHGNPFAPINFVVDKFGHLGHPDRPAPVDLFGSRGSARGQAPHKDAKARGADERRPSRSEAPERAAPAPDRSRAPAPANASGQATGSRLVSDRVSHSRGHERAREARAPRHHERHKPLVVRHPHPPVRRPPSGGHTPPRHPEYPGVPVHEKPRPEVSKPLPGERPAPPDQPAPSAPDASMPSY